MSLNDTDATLKIPAHRHLLSQNHASQDFADSNAPTVVPIQVSINNIRSRTATLVSVPNAICEAVHGLKRLWHDNSRRATYSELSQLIQSPIKIDSITVVNEDTLVTDRTAAAVDEWPVDGEAIIGLPPKESIVGAPRPALDVVIGILGVVLVFGVVVIADTSSVDGMAASGFKVVPSTTKLPSEATFMRIPSMVISAPPGIKMVPFRITLPPDSTDTEVPSTIMPAAPGLNLDPPNTILPSEMIDIEGLCRPMLVASSFEAIRCS